MHKANTFTVYFASRQTLVLPWLSVPRLLS